MQLRRRQLIAGAGAAVLVLAGTGATWRVMRKPRTAFLPWSIDSGPPKDIRLDAFRHAILAPNPHNRQPWLIRLEGSDGALISCDLEKRLPETDPFDRQIVIGFGTFLELARIAAAERGFRMTIAPFPDGEPQPRLDTRPVARLRFVPDDRIQRDSLFTQISKRRTNRSIYDQARAVPELLARRVSEGPCTVDPTRIAAIRQVAVAAITVEITTPHTFGESIEVMRIGADEVDANPDGLVLTGPAMEAAHMIGMLDRESLADPASLAFKSGLKQQQDICGSIPALMWITTPGNSRIDQLEAGRRYVRANLRATALGLAIHPLSQSLQEYGEMSPLYQRIHNLLAAARSERVQMLARMGYAGPVGPSPRWPLEKHLIA